MTQTHNEEQSLEALYRDVLFEHYRHPRNRGRIADAQIVAHGDNPLCGDCVTIYGKLDGGGCFEKVSFDGKGCAICTASSSMMTQAMPGKSLEEAERLAGRFRQMLRDEVPFEAPPEAPDLEALAGVKKFPVRVKCATLAWTTLKNAILAFRAGKQAGETSTEKE